MCQTVPLSCVGRHSAGISLDHGPPASALEVALGLQGWTLSRTALVSTAPLFLSRQGWSHVDSLPDASTSLFRGGGAAAGALGVRASGVLTADEEEL